ncbi:MAG TPA: ParB N-terminal domain-containing protein [Candidatus Angelobacter sp.]
MIEKQIESIPIAEIRVVNPRSRDKLRFHIIVANIEAVGLKRPITVAKRALEPDGTQYDLVCGQGRMEALAALGETTVPAIVADAPREEQLLMSLVENIARRPPSNTDLIREVRDLIKRKCKPEDIARKLGLDKPYISGVVHLIEHGEDALVAAAEAGKLPITVAVHIASGNDQEINRALGEAYEKGDLRGNRLRVAKRIIARRIAKQREAGKTGHARRKLTGDAIVREYQHQLREQKGLVAKAATVKDRLLLLESALRKLMADEHFLNLLRAEQLTDLPDLLSARLK